MARTNVNSSGKMAARARPRAEVRPATARLSKTARLTYRDAGVDIDAKMKAIERIKGIARGTQREGVLGEIGAFGGLFDLLAAGSWRRPVLVGSTDGVGTKIKVAMRIGDHTTVGQDLVNHCVNDILVQGAVPLFFLDYIAMGKVTAPVLGDLASGMAKACREAGCALLGGETAEMPDLYDAGEYDLAGFIVGAVDKHLLIDGSRISAGDVLIGLPSSGLHTNGYSLARKIFFERRQLKASAVVPEIGRSVGEELLAVHRSYLPVLRGLLPGGALYGMAHITGGGFTDNIPRILPKGVAARLELGSWPVPPVFRYLWREGRVRDEEMLRTFNMGIGMVLVVPAHREAEVTTHLDQRREKHWRIGEIVPGPRRVIYTRPAGASDEAWISTPDS
ncbi:MAG TPA: phosphoribosylformylglycinamidine cyclo-ligase [Candidatus Polarisedimenticolia bacterium]|jgi:phosphoribosylformylglycinamidine cyclo-ligase|nr:phosphoribosylformylglycinamidine cyclo-ligase [Candidatus Polarisedimenticolia bacterium]